MLRTQTSFWLKLMFGEEKGGGEGGRGGGGGGAGKGFKKPHAGG